MAKNPAPTNETKAVAGKPKQQRMDRLFRVGFFVSLITLCYILGATAAEFRWFGYSKTLKPAFEAIRALKDQKTTDWVVHGYGTTPFNRSGIGRHYPEKTLAGYTLYSTFGDGGVASLIDMEGRVVHKWQMPFSKLWDKPPHVSIAVDDSMIHWTRLRAFPNGDLIAQYTSLGDTPTGYGLVRLDKDSRVLWRYAERVHHDFDIDPQGRICTLLHHFRQEPVEGAPHLQTPSLEDFIAVLSPQGEELQRINIFKAFSKSQFRGILDSMKSEKVGDHTHTNTAHYITPEFAAKHTFCKAGDVLISLRNYSVLAIVNLESEEVVWAARGHWSDQHDPDPLPNGNLLIFDNLGSRGPGGRSRVMEWNPTTGAVEWVYQGTPEDPFESPVRADQQLLANGNVLINESSRGRILEVTRAGEVVWEFYNSLRHPEYKDKVAVTCSAVRYTAAELPFLGKSPAEVAAKDSRQTVQQ